MQLQKSLLPTTVFIALSIAPIAYAETPEDAPKPDKKFYVEGGYTVYNEIGENYTGTRDVSSDALTLRLGYSFNRYFDLEGEFSASGDAAPEDWSRNVKYGYGLYTKANLPIGDKVDLFARLGAVATHMESKGYGLIYDFEDGVQVNPFPSRSENLAVGIAAGLGASYDLSDGLYLRGDYQRMTTETDDFDTLSVAIGMRF